MKSCTTSRKPLLAAELAEFPQQRAVAGVGVELRFLPAQPVLCRRLDDAIPQPFGFVPGQQQLDGSEERPDELWLLVVEILADALAHGHRGALQLQDGEGDAVHVEDEIRPLRVRPGDRHLLGEREIIGPRVLPVHEPDGVVLLASGRPDLHSVAEEVIHPAVSRP